MFSKRSVVRWSVLGALAVVGCAPEGFAPDGAPDAWARLDEASIATGPAGADWSDGVLASSEVAFVVGAADDRKVHVYERHPSGDWREVARFSGGGAFTGFGETVAVNDDTLLVGKPYDSVVAQSSGSVAVFRRAGDRQWSTGGALTPAVGGAFDLFGTQVALAGDHAAITAPGLDTVYVFERDDTGAWSEMQALSTGAEFGNSVAMDVGRILVGGDPGAVLFELDDTGVWSLAREFVEADAVWGPAIRGDWIALGTPNLSTLDHALRGDVRFFQYDGAAWLARSPVTPPFPATGGRFGESIALHPERVLVAQPGEELVLGDPARLEVLELVGGQWTCAQTLEAPADGAVHRLASSVSASGDRFFALDPSVLAVHVYDWTADAQMTLEVVGACPSVTLTASAATPSANVGVLAGGTFGSATVPGGPCAGTALGIAGGVRKVGMLTADGGGDLDEAVSFDPADCGGVVQLLDLATCGLSDPLPL